MMLKLVLFTALIVTFVTTQPTIKSDWSQVNVKPSTLENEGYSVAPRAAAFSDGRYIVVYTIVTDSADYMAVGQIFFANGSIAKEEFALGPDLGPDAFVGAPNVVVFDDDTFLVVYRWDNLNPLAQIFAQRFNADAKPASASFQLDTDYPAQNTLQEGIELVGFADKSFAILYFSGANSCTAAAYFDSQNIARAASCLISTEGTAGGSIVGDSSRRTSYLVTETNSVDLLIGEVTNRGVINSGTYFVDLYATNPVIALSGDRYLTYVFNNGDAMNYTVGEVGGELYSGALFPFSDGIRLSSPALIGLNETSVFLGYVKADLPQTALAYQTASIVPGPNSIELVLSSAASTIVSVVHALQFIPLGGSDLLVVGKNASDGTIMKQILTFCGNGHIELNEECDGSANCDAQCRCTNDLIGYKGVCGLPNIIPVLDCVQSVSNGHNLHFSFINEDRVAHSIALGAANMFTPTNLATDRPTTFNRGSTSSFPNSPYTVFVGSDVSSINWVLGSYNLTVDLTNVTAVQCPAYVTSNGYLTDGGSAFAANYANRYSLSAERLSTDVVQTGGSFPVKKRVVSLNSYDITVIVAPADNVNSQELSPTEAVKSVIVDFKKNSTEVEEDLLNGYDSDSNIKDITPLPTGVEVRGTRYDSSKVGSPSADTPTTPQTQTPQMNPTSVTPRSLSGASVIVPSFILATILLTLVA